MILVRILAAACLFITACREPQVATDCDPRRPLESELYKAYHLGELSLALKIVHEGGCGSENLDLVGTVLLAAILDGRRDIDQLVGVWLVDARASSFERANFVDAGYVLIALGRYQEALVWFDEVSRSYPERAHVEVVRATVVRKGMRANSEPSAVLAEIISRLRDGLPKS